MIFHTILCCGIFFATDELPDGQAFAFSDDCKFDAWDAERFLTGDDVLWWDFPRHDYILNAILYGVEGFEKTSIKTIAWRTPDGRWHRGYDALPYAYAHLDAATGGANDRIQL